MPVFEGLKKVMLIGSGPIVIGQAAEFDYAGTQACRALKSLGLSVVLVNPNPATIMTDAEIADRIYIEPLTIEVIKRIIKQEQPDGLLSTLGGQNGLTLSMQLASSGFLEKQNVKLLGATLETIDRAEDRLLFKQTMEEIAQPCIPSVVVTTVPDAVAFAREIGYDVIVRPAFTLGGSGGGIASDEEELLELARTGIETSPIGQILVEKCVAGWKEIEFEVVRDGADNAIVVCSMENMDPVGVHTGDSIVVAPAVTLADKEYQMLRSAAISIVRRLKVQGGCNVQFALHPESMEYAVIEVNPRVSRSSALASKATGYPIAKVATQIAVGLRLDEIRNAVTGKTSAFFEPSVDYIVTKLPRWPFDKFVFAQRTLGTQMKATGEVMSIATSFEEGIMKAVRGAALHTDTLRLSSIAGLSDAEVERRLKKPTDERLFLLYEAIARGVSVEKLHELTMVDEWFLYKLKNIAAAESELASGRLSGGLYEKAKRLGFTDAAIERISGQRIEKPLRPVYKMVDTCAAEFAAQSPYFYSAYDAHDEAADFIAGKEKKPVVVVLGSGPIRIGQGIEFDYASVHCVWTLKELGYEVVMINNNPETVSTDFDTADRLYFEALTPEDVLNIIALERPVGVVTSFGGQTAISLARTLQEHGIPILGTDADAIDEAEDRERFDAILQSCGIERPQGRGVMTKAEALAAANELAYPVLIRPSYVLGGQNMIIASCDDDVCQYMDIILANGIENPVLVDKYLMGTEVEVDAICDGKDVLIPGIMEHIERAGVHSGDSIAVYPAWNLTGPVTQKLIECTKLLAVALNTRGLINIQYVIYENRVYVIEANPRASRTIPYISKVTGLPVVDAATRVMMGEKLSDMPYGTGLYRRSDYVAVKVPVFSFEKLYGVDTLLGPEMKSTGEVLGIGGTMEEAIYKGLLSAGYTVNRGGALITVRDADKAEAIGTARKFRKLGCELYATGGTAEALRNAGLPCTVVKKLKDGSDEIFELMNSGKVRYMLSTSSYGGAPDRDSVKLRRKAVERRVVCLTSIDTANALVNAVMSGYGENTVELIDIAHLPSRKKKLKFVKMRGSGNDYIFFDCFAQTVESPEALSVRLSDRRRGIGGDGIVLIYPSDIADAKMVMYNADGTPGFVAGNAMRCVAKLLYESGHTKKTHLSIETGSGVREMDLFVADGEVYSVRVYMGAPDFDPAAVPIKSDAPMIDAKYSVLGSELNMTCLTIGNPHCVVFTKDAEGVELEKYGPALEHAPLFPHRANISFAQMISPLEITMRVWERGIGETWACGTGACAVVAAAVKLNKCPADRDVTVHLRGGDLIINCGGTITMTGDCARDYEGMIEI